MIYRLKAPTRKDIENAIPFDLYSVDEDGNEFLVPSTEEYGYYFLGHETLEEPQYDEEGNLIKEGTYSDYVLADLLTREPVEIGDSAEVLSEPDSPLHTWA